jgi:hypothetical protein
MIISFLDFLKFRNWGFFDFENSKKLATGGYITKSKSDSINW